MKRNVISIFLACIVFVLFLVGCGSNTSSIDLPANEEIDAINITLINGTEVSYDAPEYIEQFISAMADVKATTKKSVQDFPTSKEYGTVEIESTNKTVTMYYYEESGKKYIEQPYRGIYETDIDLESLFAGVE